MALRLKPCVFIGNTATAALLLVMVGCIPMSGCLIPQDDYVFGELPPRRNRPLKIVGHNPPGLAVKFFNSARCADKNEPFTVIVEDEDVQDEVRSRWVINDNNTDYEPKAVTVRNVVREVPAPSSTFPSAMANLPTGTALLSVYATDSLFLESGDRTNVTRALVTLPDGTSVVDKGSVDSFTWTLNVVPCE